MITIRMTKPLALAALLMLGTAPGAFAAADDAMLARLKSFAAEQGATIEWNSVNEFTNDKDEDVTSLTDVKISSEGKTTPVSQIDLVDVEEEDGGWRIGSLRVPSISVTDQDSEVWLYDMSVDGLLLPPEGAQDDSAVPSYTGAGVREIDVRVKDNDVFKLSDFHMEVTPPEDGGPMEFSGAAESFHVDLAGVEDEKAQAALDKMGYKALDGYLEIEGSWNPSDGHLSLAKYDISVKDAGTLGISLELGGYTRELLASLKKLQAQAAANKGGDNSAQGIAMLGLLQQMTFESARIEFTDDSLTSRALDLVASQQGAKPADVANQAKALVPFAMMQLNNPALTQMVTQAVSNFLDNPQNFAILAQPPSPIPFALIAAGAMSAPQGLPQQLGVKVVANE